MSNNVLLAAEFKLVPQDTGVSSTSTPEESWSKNYLTDDNFSSCWSSKGYSSADQQEWFWVKLSGVFEITKIVLYPRNAGYGFPVNFQIQYTTENEINSQTIWYDFPNKKFINFSNPGNNPITIDFKPLSATAIRVLATRLSPDDYNNYYFQLAEIEIFGQEQSPFYTSLASQFDADLNNMWKIYGEVSDGSNTVHGLNGWNTPDYFALVSPKFMWTTSTLDYQQALRQKMRDYPMAPGNSPDRGYFWSWTTFDGWASNGGRNYTMNSGYIIALYNYYLWTKDETIFNDLDQTTISVAQANQSFEADKKKHKMAISLSFPDNVDISEGKTVLEKARMAMKALLKEHNGENGLLIINDPRADGTLNGLPTNYADNYLDGYKSAYNNIYFYRALIAMAGIEKALGNNDDSNYYQNLASQVKENFNNVFWHGYFHRYINTIDKNGRGWDFGSTYLNLEAIFSGLANPDQINEIYSWLDGTRIIDDDTSKGADIYSLNWAPRWNTRSIESVPVDNKYWWWAIPQADENGNPTGKFYCTVGPLTASVTGSSTCSWGEHQTNGGAIFFPSFYDVVNRARYKGADNGWERLNKIMDEFHKDQLKRDPKNNAGAKWKWGIIGEFPESGLVPTSFIYGFIGLDPQLDGLHVKPNLPSSLNFAGVKNVNHWGNVYEIKVDRSYQKATIEKISFNNFKVIVPANAAIIIANGEIYQSELDFNNDLELDFNNDFSVDIKDFKLLLKNYNFQPAGKFDLNKDQLVNNLDAGKLLLYLEKGYL